MTTKLDANVRDAIGRVRPPDIARRTRHRKRLLSRRLLEQCGETIRRQRVLRDSVRRACRCEEIRIRRLLVGDRAGKRNDDGAKAHRREFGDGDRAAAANDQIGPGVTGRHVIDEGNAFGVDFRGAIRFAQLREVFRTGLMDDLRPRRFADPR